MYPFEAAYMGAPQTGGAFLYCWRVDGCLRLGRLRTSAPLRDPRHFTVEQWTQNHVIVVRHRLAAEQFHLTLFHAFTQDCFKHREISNFTKNRGTEVPTVQRAIESAGFVRSFRAWHYLSLEVWIHQVKSEPAQFLVSPGS